MTDALVYLLKLCFQNAEWLGWS